MAVIDPARWEQLGPLLDRALELSGEARTSWLADLRSRSPDLADELTSLISDDAAADRRGFLSDPVNVSLAGVELAGYTLVRLLGRGGMGSVWLARRSDGRFDGNAAVKLLNLALVTATGQERFRREGSVLARLAHPGIARLLDAGVASSGQPYLVLEYIDGQRIDEFARDQHLARDARIRLMLQVLSAVSHAHANLIVHRDIKPSNILVSREGTATLLDFGIAKLLASESHADEPALTADGGRALTPEFAAPEQARGDAITTATDVYALGVLLYLLLSGRHPTADGCRSPSEAIAALFDVEPRRLGLGDLDTVLAKALQKVPQQRYESVAAFADDLRRYLRHEPVSARPDSIAYRTRKFVRRNRVPVIAAMVTAAGLVAATAVSIDGMREARQQRDVALFERQNAVYERRRADGRLEFQQLMLSSMGDGRVTMREIINQGKVLLEREFSHDPRLAGDIAMSLGAAYEELGDHDLMVSMYLRADSLGAVANAPDIRLLSRCSRADAFAVERDAARASALADTIRPMLATAAPEQAAECLMQLAEVQLRIEHFDSGAVLARRAVELTERGGFTTGMRYVEVLNTEANALENLKRRREALAVYERIATLMDTTGRSQALTRNIIRNNIGIALSNLGEMTAAEPVLRETVATFLRGSEDGFVHPAILINYCRTLLFLQQLDSAALWYGRLYTESIAPKDFFNQAEGANGMARVELARGRANEAARWIDRLKQADTHRKDTNANTERELEASLAHVRGDLPRATSGFDSVLRSMGYLGGKRTYFMRAVLVAAAQVALDSHDPAKALEYARAAHGIAFSDSLSETRSGYVGETRLLEGRALLAAGDTIGARASLTRAVTALRVGVGATHVRTRQAESLLSRMQ